MTDEMSRVIDSIALPYGTEFSPIKPKTGWSFRVDPEWFVPPDVVPDLLEETLRLAHLRALADDAEGESHGEEHEGVAAGVRFRLRELFYDGLHGLGPVGEIRRKCG